MRFIIRTFLYLKKIQSSDESGLVDSCVCVCVCVFSLFFIFVVFISLRHKVFFYLFFPFNKNGMIHYLPEVLKGCNIRIDSFSLIPLRIIKHE